MARKDLEHGRNGTQDQADSIHKVPVENYYDQARWEGEKEKNLSPYAATAGHHG